MQTGILSLVLYLEFFGGFRGEGELFVYSRVLCIY